MTEIVNKFLYAGDRLLKMPLKQPESIYSAFISFNKNNEEIQNFKEAGDTCYVYQNKKDKACFEYDIAYDSYKGLVKRIESWQKRFWEKKYLKLLFIWGSIVNKEGYFNGSRAFR